MKTLMPQLFFYISFFRFLDVWQVGKACCHPDHRNEDDTLPLNHLVSNIVHVQGPQCFIILIYIRFEVTFQCNFQTLILKVSMVMSVKILQSEGKVLPISGKLCQACKDSYDTKYTSKTGEKIVIIMPRAQLPMASPLTVPSPFCRLSPTQKGPKNVVEMYNEPMVAENDIKPGQFLNFGPAIANPIGNIKNLWFSCITPHFIILG